MSVTLVMTLTPNAVARGEAHYKAPCSRARSASTCALEMRRCRYLRPSTCSHRQRAALADPESWGTQVLTGEHPLCRSST